MPINRRVMFVCENCGYKEVRTIGDVRPDLRELKPCPKCGSRMVASYDENSKENIESMIEKVLDIFRK